MFENHPPKELTSCHLKPAHCFYSIQMFSSILSLLSPPSLPLPSTLSLRFRCVYGWHVGGKKRTSMKCALSLIITFRFLLHFFRCQNVLTYQLCSTTYSPSPLRRPLTTLYEMSLEGLPGPAHPSFISFLWKQKKCMWFFYIQLVFCPNRAYFQPLTTVHAYMF